MKGEDLIKLDGAKAPTLESSVTLRRDSKRTVNRGLVCVQFIVLPFVVVVMPNFAVRGSF